MKLFLLSILFPVISLAAGKIQNEDVKTLTELINAGGSMAQLINDTKVYVSAGSLNKQLSTSITDGSLGNASLPSQAGNAGEFLTTNGTVVSWAPTGAGTPVYQQYFVLDGPYAAVIGTSANDQGSRFICPLATGCKITSVCMWVKIKGTSGTTTLDLKRASKAVPNTFATIFSTLPAATTTITNGEYKCTGDTGTGWTIPVMSPSPFLMGQFDTLRLDVTGVMAGSEDAGLVINYELQ